MASLVPNLGIFFWKFCKLDKCEGADFKYDNNVFKFQPQNTEIWHFWSQTSEFLFFAQNKGNSRVLISNMTMVFQNCGLKHPNKAFLIPNLRIIIFARNFAIRQFGGR